MNLFCSSVKQLLLKYLRGYKIIMIFNIKTDKDNTFVTPPEIIWLWKKLSFKNKQTRNARNNKAALRKRK
jgi:hypothetical protein